MLRPAKMCAPCFAAPQYVQFDLITDSHAVCFGVAHHPSCKIHLATDGVVIVDTDLTRVHTGPNSDGRVPRVVMKSDSKPHCRGGIMKERHDAVASFVHKNPITITNERRRTLVVLLKLICPHGVG